MEQHPIPQNITGFEFKLIGDMTIKQFAYLAGCAVLAWIFFASPLHPLIKFPLVIFFAIFGIALAFVPVEGRPLDRWISNFIRALFAPSQYIFHKQGASPDFLKTIVSSPNPLAVKLTAPVKPVDKSERFRDYLHTFSPPALNPDNEEQAKLSAINDAFAQRGPVSQPQQEQKVPIASPSREPEQKMPILSGFQVPYQNIVSTASNIPPAPSAHNESPKETNEEKLKEERALLEENTKLRLELERIKKKLHAPQAAPSENVQKWMAQDALAVEKKLHEALSERERLASELAKLKIAPQVPSNTVTPTMAPPPKPSEKVRIIPQVQAKTIGVAGLPQLPNLIAGIVKDAKGDVLPNIIIEVKDSLGNPVRAFKTNKIGQFSAATSLANGKYTIELEDPKGTYTFEVIAIELTGGFFQPLEIIAKGAMARERQELYQALFGSRT